MKPVERRARGPANSYSDRVCAPSETIARLRPHLTSLGITRVARQTGLDTIGIPCFSAIRPNAITLSVSQGKGVDDDAAVASAIMEAAEFAIAERPLPVAWRGPARALRQMGAAWVDPGRFLPLGDALDVDRPLSWVAGRGLLSSMPVLVPRDIVRFDGQAPDLPSISQSTNGLASGNTSNEAVFHALCELIERDATTLWSLHTIEERKPLAVALDSLGDRVVDDLAERVANAGLTLRLFDITTDIGVPSFFALIGSPTSSHYFEFASGAGTHPVAARAAIRAITEAAQSRLTAIAGARDDIDTLEYSKAPDAAARTLLGTVPVRPAPSGLPLGSDLMSAFRFTRQAIARTGVDEPVVVHLGGESYGFAAVRLVSTTLEDREANANWRPGARSVAWLATNC